MAQAVATLTMPALCAADLNLTINHEPRVLDLRLAEALGFDRPRNIRRLISRYLDVLRGFGQVCSIRSKPSAQGGRPGTDYYLNKRQALFITAKSDTERAALVTVQMVEVFDAVTSGRAVAIPAHTRRLPRPRPTPPEREGFGCLMHDGKLIRFDSRRRPSPGDMILIARRDGTLDVVMLPEQHRDVSPAVPGAGVVYVLKKGEQFGRVHCREQVALVGAVTTAGGRSIRSDEADAYREMYAGR